MNFNEELTAYRRRKGLSIEQAAERVHLSALAYKDREEDRETVKFPERLGLLMGLGMDYEQAAGIASEPALHHASELEQYMKKAVEDPFVREDDDAFILIDRDHESEYTILKSRVESAEDILGWIDQLTEKMWVHPEHIRVFLRLASLYLKITIHPI